MVFVISFSVAVGEMVALRGTRIVHGGHYVLSAVMCVVLCAVQDS